ncbi:hypothetical protein ACFZDG_35580 [Kitasatospora xanthocidica]|uniref:hypothetical protein n=1 Tax=Kitasatospora xanthocidica TaxID=83382 RepID=UPI0036E391A5
MAARSDSRQAKLARAREEARLRNAEKRKEEEKLEDLATEYFFLQGEITDAREAAAKRIADIQEELAKAVAGLEEQATSIVGQVAVLRTAQEASTRLGVPVAAATAARKLAKATPVDSAPADSGKPEPDAPSEDADSTAGTAAESVSGQVPGQAGSPDGAGQTQPPEVPV